MEKIKNALLTIMDRGNLYENDIDETISNLYQIEADEVILRLAESHLNEELENIGLKFDDDINDFVIDDEFYTLLDKATEEAEDEIRQSYIESECMEDLYFESMRW